MLRSSRRFGKTSEFKGAYAGIGGWALVVLAAATFLSVQNSLFAMLLPSAVPEAAQSGARLAFSQHVFALAKSALLTSPLIVVLVSLFGDSLARFATEEATAMSRKLAKHASKLAILAGALALPSLLWLVYLRIVYWGLLCNEPGAICLQWLPVQGVRSAIDAFFPAAVIALLALALMLAMRWLKPNAYSLHRLYRDRLAKAFVIHPMREDPNYPGDRDMLYALKMSQLVRKPEQPGGASFVHGPFPLMNTALNVQSSALVNRRGRNADFFVFTPLHAGSMATGYVSMKRLEAADPTLDLAAVMAISGAAASSNMGANTVRPMSTTLALLNVRLGYWLPNPRKLIEHGYRAKRGLFLWQEMTSLLDENTANVLLTDGGHIENLGIYELLRRRCKLIVAVDAEADRGMNFGSFIALQRYARIDLGIRIELPWQRIALATRAQMAAGSDQAKAPASAKGPHVALGTINYDNGDTGLLLYIKSSLTGDENDYVRDYARRNPSFPHETTADQFFSEEQFEAYRALGFHGAHRALSCEDEIVMPDGTLGRFNAQTGKKRGGHAQSPAEQVVSMLGL
jgi:hypothetical protein